MRNGASGRGRMARDDSVYLQWQKAEGIPAYTGSYVPLSNAARVMTSVYDVPNASVRVRGALTHTVPTGPYRGAGRPEAIYVLERLLDVAADRLGMDRVALRRRNVIGREQLPYTSAVGLTYDSGDFAGNFERVLALADCTALPVHVCAVPEGGALGAAFLARMAAGLETSTNEAARWARTSHVVDPDPAWATAVADRYARFCERIQSVPPRDLSTLGKRSKPIVVLYTWTI